MSIQVSNLTKSDSYVWTDSDFEQCCSDFEQEFSEDDEEEYKDFAADLMTRTTTPKPAITTNEPPKIPEVIPATQPRQDGIGHPISFDPKKYRSSCKQLRCHAKTRNYCAQCKVHLCFNKLKNCFAEYHKFPIKSSDSETQQGSRKRLRSASTSSCSSNQPPKKRPRETKPNDEMRLDGIDHYCVFDELTSRSTCKNKGCKSKTFSYCEKCNVHLCVNSKKNCFLAFHSPELEH
jgi:hypothetical protein